MAFRCESDESENELTPMQDDIIQPYQLEPVVEARRIDLGGGHRLEETEGRIGNSPYSRIRH